MLAWQPCAASVSCREGGCEQWLGDACHCSMGCIFSHVACWQRQEQLSHSNGGGVLQVDTFTAERYSPHNAHPQSRLQAAAAAAEGSMLLNDRVCEQQHFSSCRRCCKFHTKYLKILRLSLLSVLFCFRDCGTCLSVCVDVCSAPQHCLDAFLGQQRHQTSSGQGGAGTRFWQICGFRLVHIAAGSHYCWCRPP
jgi:hypothetical protein